MSNRRNALGRGLGALLPGTPGTSGPAAGAAVREAVRDATREAATAAGEAPTSELPIDLIDPNPEQPRRVFQEEELERLAASIRQHGVLQPVVVRRAGDRYELVVGERRWRASQLAGLARLPVVVSDVEPRRPAGPGADRERPARGT